MPTVTTPETYTTGSLFDPDGHNNNIFGATANVGILRGLNGGLGASNLDSGFQLQRDHIQPGGLIALASTPIQPRPVDYMSELMGSSDGVESVVISGAASRFYLPYACAWVMFEIQATVGQFIVAAQTLNIGASDDTTTDTDAWLYVFVDGLRQSYCDTKLHNWATDNVLKTNSPTDVYYSGRCTRHYSFQVLKQDLSAGWHEVNLRVGIARGDLTYTREDFTGDFATNTYYIFSRVSAYNRAGNILGFK